MAYSAVDVEIWRQVFRPNVCGRILEISSSMATEAESRKRTKYQSLAATYFVLVAVETLGALGEEARGGIYQRPWPSNCRHDRRAAFVVVSLPASQHCNPARQRRFRRWNFAAVVWSGWHFLYIVCIHWKVKQLLGAFKDLSWQLSSLRLLH